MSIEVLNWNLNCSVCMGNITVVYSDTKYISVYCLLARHSFYNGITYKYILCIVSVIHNAVFFPGMEKWCQFNINVGGVLYMVLNGNLNGVL